MPPPSPPPDMLAHLRSVVGLHADRIAAGREPEQVGYRATCRIAGMLGAGRLPPPQQVALHTWICDALRDETAAARAKVQPGPRW